MCTTVDRFQPCVVLCHFELCHLVARIESLRSEIAACALAWPSPGTEKPVSEFSEEEASQKPEI